MLPHRQNQIQLSSFGPHGTADCFKFEGWNAQNRGNERDFRFGGHAALQPFIDGRVVDIEFLCRIGWREFFSCSRSLVYPVPQDSRECFGYPIHVREHDLDIQNAITFFGKPKHLCVTCLK